MPLSSAEIKRQILLQSEKTGIKKDILREPPPGMTNDDIIEQGQALEQMTRTKGWTIVEAYLLRSIDIVGIFYGESANERKIGQGQALIGLMHYVDQMIRAKDELLQKAEKERSEKK